MQFLTYKDRLVILALAISNKKTQQATIDKIISELKEYNEIINKRINEL